MIKLYTNYTSFWFRTVTLHLSRLSDGLRNIRFFTKRLQFSVQLATLLVCILLSVGSAFNSFAQSNIDTDGDGIVDSIDLDDDNDGILDRDEDCAYLAQNSSGTWIGQTNSTATVSRNGTLTTFTSTYNGLQNRFQINQGGGGQWVDVLGEVSYQMTFSGAGVPASEIAIFIYDLTPSLSTGFNNFTIRINGTTPNNIFSSIQVTSATGSGPVTGYLNYNAATGVATFNSSGGNSQSLMLNGAGNTMITSITITSSGLVAQDRTEYSIFGKKICDADGDLIPNYLDLDSDGDGCFDAIEGDENVLATQLNPNGSINTGSTGGIGTTAAVNNGVPNLVNTGGVADIGGDVGQGVGASQNSLINTCLDSDNDGIPDICDLDDDNDGILDVNENSCALVGQTIRIGYIPNARDLDTDNGYTFDGALMNGSGALKLTNTANFGSSGIVKANIVLVNMGTAPITKAIINSLNLNVIFLGGIDNGTAPPVSYLSSAEYDAIKDWSDDALTNLVVATQSSTLAWGSSITSGNTNPDVPTTYGSQTSIFNGPFGTVTSFDQGGGYQAYFASINSLCSGTSPLAVDASNRAVMYIDGTYGDLMLADVDILTTYGGVTAGNAITSNNDRLFANIWAFVAQQSICTDKDLDGDGIPNRFDLDSDNDGCPDAIEGAADITALFNSAMPGGNVGATSGTFNKPVVQNLGNTVNTTAGSSNYGVPTIAGTGQGIGQSQTINPLAAGTASASQAIYSGQTPNPLTLTGSMGASIQWQSSADNISYANVASGGTTASYSPGASATTSYYRAMTTSLGGCTATSNVVSIVVCNNLPLSGTPDNFTKTGVSSLVGFAGGWPGNVPNGFIAIESKNKGFVITRVKSVSDIPVADLVEGMLVYDIQSACIKLYNGSIWKCLEKDCAFATN